MLSEAPSQRLAEVEHVPNSIEFGTSVHRQFESSALFILGPFALFSRQPERRRMNDLITTQQIMISLALGVMGNFLALLLVKLWKSASENFRNRLIERERLETEFYEKALSTGLLPYLAIRRGVSFICRVLVIFIMPSMFVAESVILQPYKMRVVEELHRPERYNTFSLILVAMVSVLAFYLFRECYLLPTMRFRSLWRFVCKKYGFPESQR